MEQIGTLVSKDGKNRIDFERDENGLYQFVTFDDRYRGNEDFHNPPYWSIAKFSGLYDSIAAMEADARQEFDWIRM